MELMKAFQNKKVLLVEDDEDSLDELASVLEMYFSKVAKAKSGTDGISKFKTDNFDIVITDVKMQQTDGISLSKLLKMQNKTLPILITTAFSGCEYFAELSKMQNVAFLKKPIDLDELFINVYQLLQSKCSQNVIKLSPSCAFSLDTKELQKNGTFTKLTKTEIGILYLLCKSVGHIVSNDEITAYLGNEFLSPESIRSHLSNLRKKIAPAKIKSIKFVGYILEVSN